jgi:hypothetical protein
VSIEIQLENAKLKILAEMNEKIDETVSELNDKGTEFARRLAAEIKTEKEKVATELEELWSFTKSKLISIEAGQKLFHQEIVPNLMNKMEVTVGMARDAAAYTAQSGKDAKRAERAAERSEDLHRTANWQRIGLIVAFVLAALSGGIKIWQDWRNQEETAAYLRTLTSGVIIQSTPAEKAPGLGHQQSPEEIKNKEGK